MMIKDLQSEQQKEFSDNARSVVKEVIRNRLLEHVEKSKKDEKGKRAIREYGLISFRNVSIIFKANESEEEFITFYNTRKIRGLESLLKETAAEIFEDGEIKLEMEKTVFEGDYSAIPLRGSVCIKEK